MSKNEHLHYDLHIFGGFPLIYLMFEANHKQNQYKSPHMSISVEIAYYLTININILINLKYILCAELITFSISLKISSTDNPNIP